VHDAECTVAVLIGVDEDAKGHDVGELLERDVLALHFAPDRVRAFFAAEHRCAKAYLGKIALQLPGNAGDEVAALGAEEIEAADDRLARLCVEFGEGEILEFVLDRVHADAFGKRRVDIHRFHRDAPALFRLGDVVEGPHVVQAIRQLDDENAQVVRHREQQLAEVLRLARPLRRAHVLEHGEFGDAVDELGDLGTELAVDLVESGNGVLDGVVQQGRRDGGGIEPHVGDDAGDLKRMGEIRRAAGALLGTVGLERKAVGAGEQVGVSVGVVAPDPRDEIVGRRQGGVRDGAHATAPGRPARRTVVGWGGRRAALTVLRPGVMGRALRPGGDIVVEVFGLGLRGRLRLGGPVARHQHRHIVLFRLVAFDLFLQAGDQRFVEFVGGHGLVRDLAQGDDGVLVVVAVDGELGTGRNLARPLGGQDHQFKAVGNDFDAVLDGDAGHSALQCGYPELGATPGPRPGTRLLDMTLRCTTQGFRWDFKGLAAIPQAAARSPPGRGGR
jgi:hypothetical protein